MIIVLLIVCIALIIVGAWLYNHSDYDDFFMIMVAFGVCGLIASSIATAILLANLSQLRVIQPKIEMYEEQNAVIEAQISECVKQYQEYEKDIFTEVAPDSSIALVALYPELKADTLVQKQIEVYMSNNEKINKLKEKLINGDVIRWWVYFGGKSTIPHE